MLQTSHPFRWKLSALLLGAILLLALVARLRYLDQIEHNIDHAYPVWQALMTLDHAVYPLKGQGTSVLFANPALTGYLYIPAVALTRSPLGVYVLVILLNTLGVWMSYRAARTLVGARLALLAAALVAVNPWMIEYSRTSWVQSLLPFFVPAVAWLLWPVLMGKSRVPARRTLLALGVMTLLTQTYLLAFFIVAPVALLLLIYRARLHWRGVMAGMGVFALATLLYGTALLGDRDDLRGRVENFTSGDPHITREAWDSAVRLVSGAEYAAARGLQAPADDAGLRHDLSQIAHTVVLAGIVIGIGGAVVAIYKGSAQRDAAVIALVWFGLPIIAMSYTGSPVHPFYQLLGIPAGAVLAAWGFGLVFQPERWRLGGVALVVAFVPFAVLMLVNSARYYQETAAIPGAHQMSALSMEYGLRLGEAIRGHREPGQVVFADEAEWIMNSFAGETFIVIRDTRAPDLTLIPANDTLYITFGADAATPISGTLAERIDLPDETAMTVYTISSVHAAAIPGTPLNIPTQQGITLVSYDLTRTGDDWTLQTVWQVESVAPEVPGHIYAPFIHLFDAEGRRVGIIDGAGLRGDLWRPGWQHIYRMTFMLPDDAPGPFTLQIGQFDGLQGDNVIFLLEDGEPSVTVDIPEQISR